ACFGRHAGAQPDASELPGLHGVRALVIDDNASSLQMLEQVLTAEHMRVAAMSQGPPALDALRAAANAGHPYTLALVDRDMPRRNGLTLAQHVSADPCLAETRIVLMTPLGQCELTQDLLDLGVV